MSATTDQNIPRWDLDFYDGVLPKRLIAWFIDVALTALLAAPLMLPVLALGVVLIFPLLLIPMIWAITGFVYRWATISNNSATWGMRIMAIELRNSAGARLNLPEAALHTLGYTISIGSLIIQAVSVVLMCASLRGQSLSDHVLGTVMINRRARH